MPARVSTINMQREEGVAYALSYGIGVDSTAMLVLAIQQGLPLDYVVAADPGDEMPETYWYLEYMKSFLESKGIELHVVRSKSGRSLSQRCISRRVIPDVIRRWCTRDLKIRPIHTFYRALQKPVVQYIGFDKNEGKRIRKAEKRKPDEKLDIRNAYPLHDMGLDRDACVEMIRGAGLHVPIKSSCFYCPYKSTEQWVYLYKNHPALFWKAVEMEESNKYWPRQKLFVIPLRELARLIDEGKPLPKSKFKDMCGSL